MVYFPLCPVNSRQLSPLGRLHRSLALRSHGHHLQPTTCFDDQRGWNGNCCHHHDGHHELWCALFLSYSCWYRLESFSTNRFRGCKHLSVHLCPTLYRRSRPCSIPWCHVWVYLLVAVIWSPHRVDRHQLDGIHAHETMLSYSTRTLLNHPWVLDYCPAFLSRISTMSFPFQLFNLTIIGLLNKGKEQQAENALRRVRGGSVDETAMRKELDDMIEANSLEMAMKKSAVFMDLWRGTNLVWLGSPFMLTVSGVPFSPSLVVSSKLQLVPPSWLITRRHVRTCCLSDRSTSF